MALGCAGVAQAAVQVITGPTSIQDGEAKGARDITVVNEKLAFALAVGSAVPYGVPRGAIIDVTAVQAGKIGRDRVVFADFIPNHWSAWPNTYQRVEVVEQGPEQAVIRAVRDWGQVTITTTYKLRENADRVEMQTTMVNTGGASAPDLLSGFTLWSKGGFFFGIPGMAGIPESKADGALSDRVVAYDADWMVALHAPYLDYIGSESRDLFMRHTLAPGESRTFDGWLQVGACGDLAPVIRGELERKHLASGTVGGSVAARSGEAVEQPVVVVERQGKPFGWVLGEHGKFELALPEGDYSLYATAQGYSRSHPIALKVAAGTRASQDFKDLDSPGHLEFSVTDAGSGRPLDARIVIAQGQKPLVGFLGHGTFFTDLTRKGWTDIEIAPGDYAFAVSAGGGFVSSAVQVKVTVKPAARARSNVAVKTLFNASTRGWYSADLHHHADQAEAVTPPADLARSQLAAGLDLLFVSDHDSTVNHAALMKIAAVRGIPFVPSMEISPSWGHFNAYPLEPGQKLQIDPGKANINEILREARRQGAVVVQANHPVIPFGYFTSVEHGVAPGGFNPGFELVEINATVADDDIKVLNKMWAFWNAGHRFYLSGGTDTHDVWNEESGRVRTFAHVEGPLTARTFAAALKDGRAYVSRGPLIYPSVTFGETLKVRPNEVFSLAFELESVAGLKQVQLIRQGVVAGTRAFADAPQTGRVEFPLKAEGPGWCSLIVEDRNGHKAYTDPIWVDPVEYPQH